MTVITKRASCRLCCSLPSHLDTSPTLNQADLTQELERLSRLIHRNRKTHHIKISTTNGRVIMAQDITLAQDVPGGRYFRYAPMGLHRRWESLWLHEVQQVECLTA